MLFLFPSIFHCIHFLEITCLVSASEIKEATTSPFYWKGHWEHKREHNANKREHHQKQQGNPLTRPRQSRLTSCGNIFTTWGCKDEVVVGVGSEKGWEIVTLRSRGFSQSNTLSEWASELSLSFLVFFSLLMIKVNAWESKGGKEVTSFHFLFEKKIDNTREKEITSVDCVHAELFSCLNHCILDHVLHGDVITHHQMSIYLKKC